MKIKIHEKLKTRVEKWRFQLLLLATVLVLILPAFSGSGALSEILFVSSMSFLFIQSVIATSSRKKRMGLWYVILAMLIIIFWLEPTGVKSRGLDVIRLATLVLFFITVTIFLVRFMLKSARVDQRVIITAVNIYLLIGIIAGSLAFLMYMIYPDAYNFPEDLIRPLFPTFLYYSFITMATVGYGDITPKIPETQTLAYLTAITGQMYVGIIIAFLVGKFMVSADRAKDSKQDG